MQVRHDTVVSMGGMNGPEASRLLAQGLSYIAADAEGSFRALRVYSTHEGPELHFVVKGYPPDDFLRAAEAQFAADNAIEHFAGEMLPQGAYQGSAYLNSILLNSGMIISAETFGLKDKAPESRCRPTEDMLAQSKFIIAHIATLPGLLSEGGITFMHTGVAGSAHLLTAESDEFSAAHDGIIPRYEGWFGADGFETWRLLGVIAGTHSSVELHFLNHRP